MGSAPGSRAGSQVSGRSGVSLASGLTEGSGDGAANKMGAGPAQPGFSNKYAGGAAQARGASLEDVK